ncbi:MAG TPA: polysaccharide deacetylase family protein [Candidatus Acidoferrales bacterium]|nr:polysaccharide deacetylase family protein [Candidatus Acidoferrales bacterium]
MNPLPAMVSSGAAAAAGVAAWGAVAPSSELFGPTLRHTASSRKIALTFDDGPNPGVTPKLLDLFERYSVRATFFLIGKFARACPELVQEICARGHLIGNHSHTHANLIFRSRAQIRDELARCQEAIAAGTHAEPPRWMRPPYGYRSPLLCGEIRRAGLRGVVMWSKSCWDWKPQPPERLIERLSRVARPGEPHGDIVVMHDGDHRALGGDRHHVPAALEHWLPRWRDAGMEFVTMEPSSATESSDTMRLPRA